MSEDWNKVREWLTIPEIGSLPKKTALELLDERDALEDLLNQEHECDQRAKDWDDLQCALSRQQRAIEVLQRALSRAAGELSEVGGGKDEDAAYQLAERILKGEVQD